MNLSLPPIASLESFPITAIVIGGFLCLVVGLIIASHFQAKKRTQALEDIAASLDMTFKKDNQRPIELGLSGMSFFKRGRSQKAQNVMRGTFADVSCLLFDYRYTTGSGKNSSTHRQTVVAFDMPGVRLPKFNCKPERFFHKFADMFGHKDINFEEYPTFSKKYRLNGDDEDDIRNIFNSAVIEHLESASEKPWSLDGDGNWLVIYRPDVKVKAKDCSQLLLDCTTLLNAMTLP